MTPPAKAAPFISHRMISLVPASFQTRSVLPLALKSAYCRIDQSGSTSSVPPPMMAPPFISHINFSPLTLLDQTMSDLPSPLKSRALAANAIGAARIITASANKQQTRAALQADFHGRIVYPL